tara:strand:+ start:1003 stop:1224 length:222 start_codon:yes stop_codon:yes gene_type:complete
MSKVKHYNTRLSHTKLDFLSDVLCDFCEQQELPFISADDILYGDLRDSLTAYSINWLEKYIQVWDIIQEEEVN